MGIPLDVSPTGAAMYSSEHENFRAPVNGDINVWRYMDFARLASMLSTGSLWFSRADLLGDPHEGASGEYNVRMRNETYGEYPLVLPKPAEVKERTRRFVYVNCWHAADIESVAMWRAYTAVGQGVAVQTTFEKLVNGVTDDRKFFAGEVDYFDTATRGFDDRNAFAAFLVKRPSFEYEHEVRLVYFQDRPPIPGAVFTRDSDQPAGYQFKTNLNEMIDAVYVAPQQPSWFREAVASVVAQYCPDVEVRQSRLDEAPLF